MLNWSLTTRLVLFTVEHFRCLSFLIPPRACSVGWTQGMWHEVLCDRRVSTQWGLFFIEHFYFNKVFFHIAGIPPGHQNSSQNYRPLYQLLVPPVLLNVMRKSLGTHTAVCDFSVKMSFAWNLSKAALDSDYLYLKSQMLCGRCDNCFQMCNHFLMTHNLMAG